MYNTINSMDLIILNIFLINYKLPKGQNMLNI